MKQVMAAFLVVVLFSGCALAKYKRKVSETKINTIDLAIVRDGEYEGFYDVYLINARVLVRVENHKIRSIKLVEHKYGRHSGEPMIQKVMDNQSLDVDMISGATSSSKTVLKAIETALSKGQI